MGVLDAMPRVPEVQNFLHDGPPAKEKMLSHRHCQDDIRAILTSFGPVQPSRDVIGQALMYCPVGARFLYHRTRLQKDEGARGKSQS